MIGTLSPPRILLTGHPPAVSYLEHLPRRRSSRLPRFRSVAVGAGNSYGTDIKTIIDNNASGFSHNLSRPVFCRSAERPPPAQEPLKAVSVLDEDGKLEGVIQVERDESPQPTWGRICALGGGDVVFLLLFAAIGRLSHGFPSLDWDTVRTADPFIAGWFVGSYFTGGYGPDGQGLKGLKVASIAAVKSWAAGVPLALVIRGVAIGHIPPLPFIGVSLASTFVLQVGWRTAFTAIFPNDDKSFQRKTNNRKGSAFEFLELLTSLVKRW